MEKLKRKIQAIAQKKKSEGQIGFLTEEEGWYNINAEEKVLDALMKDIIQKGNVIEFELDAGVPSLFRLIEKAKEESPEEEFHESPSNRNNLKIDKKYIVSINGKDFITYNGLLEYAKSQYGGILKREVVELKKSDDWKSASAQVRITMKEGQIFEDVGTCTPENAKGVKIYPEELAVTRGYARALRFGLVVDYCSKEELS